MAEKILTDPHVTINTKDLSDHVRSMTLKHGAEEKDITAGGDASRNRLAGLKDWSVTIEFNQDFVASEVDATLFPLVGAAPFAVVFRPDTDAKGATNPEYTGNAILTDYPVIDGGIGDVMVTNITLMGAGTLGRAIS